jgi:hypothetical protein
LARDNGSALVRDDGSALMLMPAGVLVVLVLAAIAVDAAVAFLGERELSAATAAAANDAAVAALDPSAFHRCGALRIDEQTAAGIARQTLAARGSDAVSTNNVAVSVDNSAVPPRVTVTASGAVPLIFSPAVPGGRSMAAVSARSVAVAQPVDPSVTASC